MIERNAEQNKRNNKKKNGRKAEMRLTRKVHL